MEHAFEDEQRRSLNIRVDSDKFAIIEEYRTTGFGLARTSRNRSDVYNEVLGMGLQTINLRREMGDHLFEQVWRVLHKQDINKFLAKINFDRIKD